MGSSSAIIARLVPRDTGKSPIILGEESFRFEGEGEARQAQARVVLQPSTYDLTILAVMPESSSSSLHKSVLTFPEDEQPEGIRLSDVALARELEPLPYASLASYDQPFIVGSFRMVPRVGDEVLRGEDVALFYEIYGGSRPYRTTYRIEGRDTEGHWFPLAPPAVQEGGQGAQGWSFPTGDDWPLGEYRVQILVEDAGRVSQSAQVCFELVAQKSPPEGGLSKTPQGNRGTDGGDPESP